MNFVLSAVLSLSFSAAASTQVINRRIEPNQRLPQALKAAGVGASESEQIIGALGSVFDFRKSRDGDQFRVVQTEGVLEGFDYRQGATDEWQLRRDGDTLVAQKRQVEVEKKVAVVDLTVESSLYDAALAAHEDPVIAMALSDVFAWDIDFYLDVRKGDHVRAVVEEYRCKGRLLRYGEVLAANYQGSSVGKKRVYRYQLPNGELSYFQETGASARKSFLKSPLKYAHVTSKFGNRFHPILQFLKAHNGVDYGTPVGTPVWAVADGTVTRAGTEGGAGKMVCLRHMNSLETCYLHLSGLGQAVHVGARVAQKQVIAYSGNSGLSTGPHLHFALKRGGQYINPLNQNFPRAEPLPSDLLADFQEKISDVRQQLDPVSVAGLKSALAPAVLTVP